MTPELIKEQLLLELRNAIVDKEWTIACANMELAKGGWTQDWHSCMRTDDIKVRALLNVIYDQ